MAKDFKVEPAKLTTSAKKVSDLAAKYDTEYKKIYSDIENLRVTWLGQTSDAFNAQLEGYRNDFKQLKDTLDSYVTVLMDVAKKYTAVDTKLAADAKRLSIGK